ncbi:MAG: DUF86 domain-containing protein [Phycisphaerales bacterium]|nr:DUF86 domain-containing protein [Phycisphaerales bacterium]
MSRSVIPSLLYDIVASGEAILQIRRSGASLTGSHVANTQLAAVLYNFVVIGEIVSRLGEGFWMQHPEVPWRRVVDHRNLVAHGYDVVDTDILVRTIDEHLPQLIAGVRRILEGYGPPPES